jgi:3'-phosphoadenosine 5'-phosphosulfate (PAPS) 3'-phosphatase
MTYQIQQCSPKALARTIGNEPAIVGIQAAPETGYPFVAMLAGQCFIISFEDKNEKTLRNRVAVQNKKDERKFIVIKHTEFGCYEVARVK